MSDQSFDLLPRDERLARSEEGGTDQEAIVSETDVASAGRSCLALLALFVVIFALFAIWFLYRSTT